MRRALLLLLALLPALALPQLAGCSGSDTNIEAGKEAGPLDTGPQCAAPPKTVCFPGAPMKACDEVSPQPLKAVYGDGAACPTTYVCPPGTVSVSECACNADFVKVDAGADCPGPADSGSD